MHRLSNEKGDSEKEKKSSVKHKLVIAVFINF